MKRRNQLLILLAVLSAITYLDRVCIAVAAPRIQAELGLGAREWGYVTGAFAVAYALFEVPSGYLADRFGARSMLTRIVLWWSAFTTLTGFAGRLWSLVVIRFLFGAGEAGAYPTISTVIFRWFPPIERGRSFGVVMMCSQLGGALAPLLIVPIQMRFGWRASFYIFGSMGVVWTAVWWRWYRNRPEEKPAMSASELEEIGPPQAATSGAFPWRAIAVNQSVWTLMASTFAYLYAYYFFLFWLPKYLIEARGFTERQTKLSALPFLLGAIANLSGGFARDAATRRWGPTWGPRAVGASGLATAAFGAFAALASSSGTWALAWLALCYGGITFQQPATFATSVDIGKRHAGAISGCMNTAGALGGVLSSFVFGEFIERYRNYDAVLISMGIILTVGAGLWLRTDATHTLSANRAPGA